MANDITITARARAFSGEGVRQHQFTVRPDGSVLVLDDVAGHYTRCHSLADSAQRRIRRLAREQQAQQ